MINTTIIYEYHNLLSTVRAECAECASSLAVRFKKKKRFPTAMY